MGFLNHQPSLVMPSTLVNPGTVITWGGENSGGDSRRVRHELVHVEQNLCHTSGLCGTLAGWNGALVTLVRIGNPRGGDWKISQDECIDVYSYLEFYRRISGQLTVGFWVVSIGPSGLYDCMFAGVARPSKHFHGNTHSVVGFFSMVWWFCITQGFRSTKWSVCFCLFFTYD